MGTPAYVYSRGTFEDHLRKMQEAYRELDPMICFSVKACGNLHILRLMAGQGSGFDIVSGGELYRVLQAGGDPAKVVYAGVGKTDEEIIEAIRAGIGYFNIESEQELENLIRLAEQQGTGSKTKLKAALRVNPDVDYRSHAYLETGKKETKFGVDIERAVSVFDKYARQLRGAAPCASTSISARAARPIDPFVDAVKKILPLIDRLREKGHVVEALDLGGGYGADYETETVPFGGAVRGRACAAAQGQGAQADPRTRQEHLRQRRHPADAGPLHQAGGQQEVRHRRRRHERSDPPVAVRRVPLHLAGEGGRRGSCRPRAARNCTCEGSEVVDIVGPICEGADFLAKDRSIPPVKRGDLLAVFTAGAYGFTMSSNYNARGRAPEVLVEGDSFRVIRRRETYEDLVASEK